jgi:hypothetical protein
MAARDGFLDLHQLSTKTGVVLGYVNFKWYFADLKKNQNGGVIIDGAEIDFLVFRAHF